MDSAGETIIFVSVMKTIVVASDSFKGSLASLQVADAVELGVHDVFPYCRVKKINVADGGEGTMESLERILGGEKVRVIVNDPLGRPVNVSYTVLDDGMTAVFEMSSASGLTLLEPDERNPLRTSTYGVGQIISDALSRGCRRFIAGIGGSATNDAGMGMMAALGCRFLDDTGKVLEGKGEDMAKVRDIDISDLLPGLAGSEFIVACDVDSPFCGPEGAAYVFAPQKGADSHMVGQLDAGLENMVEVIRKVTGMDVRNIPGAGAAGGLGAAFHAFLDAKLMKGAELILDIVGFDGMIKDADLVITGEGCIDSQTLTGKLPYTVMKRCVKEGVPVVAIGGCVGLSEDEDIDGFESILPVTPAGMPLAEAMNPETASANVRNTVSRIMKTYRLRK